MIFSTLASYLSPYESIDICILDLIDAKRNRLPFLPPEYLILFFQLIYMKRKDLFLFYFHLSKFRILNPQFFF